MDKFYLSFVALAFVYCLISCNGPKNTTEKSQPDAVQSEDQTSERLTNWVDLFDGEEGLVYKLQLSVAPAQGVKAHDIPTLPASF